MHKACLSPLTWPVVVVAALLAGCGGTKTAEKQMPVSSNSEKAAARPAEAAPVAPKAVESVKTEKADKKPPKKLALNPFAMPEIPEEFLPPTEAPKLVEQPAGKPAERPRVRLLGFSNVDGFKALVEVKGDVRAVTTGDIIEGIEVVSVEPPNVTFQFASSRWATKLFDQPWYSEQQSGQASLGSASTRAFANQSCSSPKLATNRATSPHPPSASATPIRPGLPGPGGGGGMPSIPGMPPSDGSSAGGIPGLSGIPGLPSGGGMPGISGGGGGAMPGAGGMPASGALPGSGSLPGGPPN
jgi:hypothetical protein